jgi:aldose 1-epimerase
VEPQTGPPDGFNLAPRIVEPGQVLAMWIDLRWS